MAGGDHLDRPGSDGTAMKNACASASVFVGTKYVGLPELVTQKYLPVTSPILPLLVPGATICPYVSPEVGGGGEAHEAGTICMPLFEESVKLTSTDRIGAIELLRAK